MFSYGENNLINFRKNHIFSDGMDNARADKKNKLRNDLIKLYGNNKNLLNTTEINQYVSKLNNPGMNSFNIKKMAYKKAYEKYYNYMLGNFAFSIFNVAKKKLKNSPTCPSGVEPEAVKHAARSELFKMGLKKGGNMQL